MIILVKTNYIIKNKYALGKIIKSFLGVNTPVPHPPKVRHCISTSTCDKVYKIRYRSGYVCTRFSMMTFFNHRETDVLYVYFLRQLETNPLGFEPYWIFSESFHHRYIFFYFCVMSNANVKHNLSFLRKRNTLKTWCKRQILINIFTKKQTDRQIYIF